MQKVILKCKLLALLAMLPTSLFSQDKIYFESDSRPIVEVVINGVRTSMLVDTGSSLNIIDTNQLLNLGIKKRFKMSSASAVFGKTTMWQLLECDVRFHGVNIYQFAATDTILSALGKIQKQITDLSTTLNREKSSNTVTTLAALPITKRLVTATVTAATTMSINAGMAIGEEIHVVVYNNSASAITQTLPSSGSYVSLSGTSITIPSYGYVEINVVRIGESLYLVRAA